VNPALAAVAVVTIGGAILAVSARDVRTIVLGLLLVLLGAPLIADPWPSPLAILARIAATLLAVRLIAIGLRGDVASGGSRIGWPAEVLMAGAAAVVGFGSHGLGAAGLGPAEAQAAGFALVVLAAAPLFTGRDALRISVGAVLLIVAASLVRAGLDPAPGDAEQLVEAVLTIALGGAVAVIVTAARAAGGLDAVDAVPGGGGHLDGAHPMPEARRATAREATSRRAPPSGAAPRVVAPRAAAPTETTRHGEGSRDAAPLEAAPDLTTRDVTARKAKTPGPRRTSRTKPDAGERP
jgi:hypothetical protein